MATLDQLHQALRNADAAGDVEAARALATHIQSLGGKSLKQSNPEEYDPSSPEYKAKHAPTGTPIQNFGAGVGKALVDTVRGVKGLFTDNGAEVAESRRLDAPLMETGSGIAGNVTGNLAALLAPGGAVKGLGALAGSARLSGAGSALMAPQSIKGAAALGLGAGAIQPAVDSGERLQNAGLGALAGGGGQAAFKGLAGIVSPQVAPGVKALMREGVTPTPGQLLGGGAARFEEGLTSAPIIGDSIKAAKTRAVVDVNRAAYNRALTPIGEKLPDGMIGNEAVEYVGEKLGERYTALMPKLTTQMDGKFIDEIQSLRNLMGSGSIDPAKAQQFENILNNQVLVKFKGDTPTLTGQTLKEIESDLGQLASQYKSSPDPDQRSLGNAIREVQEILRRNVTRSNPQSAEELKAINKGYANFKRVQRAASSVAAEDGVFSPAQLHNAVKALDRSKDKARFSEGNALMQDLSRPAKTVLGSKVPDSGTPFRMASLLTLANPKVAGAATLGTPFYTETGQKALAALLARRPDFAEPIGNALRRIAPYAAVPAIGATDR